MRILGIDPGLTTVGLGLIDVEKKQSPVAIEWLTIQTSTSLSLSDRLKELAKDLQEYLRETKPDLAVIEKLYFSNNKATAMDVAHARGVILATVAAENIEIMEVTPLQLKAAIAGDGKADKIQMQSMVKRTLNLEEIPTPADAADAVAMALFGAFSKRWQ